VGYIKIKTGPQEYKDLFIKMLSVLAEDFEQISYANQYDGQIEAYKTGPPKGRLPGLLHAFVRFEARYDGYLIAVRINKVRMSEAEEVVGRDTKLEQAILNKVNAQSDQKDSQRQAMLIREYNVSDLIVKVKPDDIGAIPAMRIITETLEPRSWSGKGGNGTIDFLPEKGILVIRHTEEIHQQVQDLLNALRRAQKRKPPPAATQP
jgi:hypothetical protein